MARDRSVDKIKELVSSSTARSMSLTHGELTEIFKSIDGLVLVCREAQGVASQAKAEASFRNLQNLQTICNRLIGNSMRAMEALKK